MPSNSQLQVPAPRSVSSQPPDLAMQAAAPPRKDQSSRQLHQKMHAWAEQVYATSRSSTELLSLLLGRPRRTPPVVNSLSVRSTAAVLHVLLLGSTACVAFPVSRHARTLGVVYSKEEFPLSVCFRRGRPAVSKEGSLTAKRSASTLSSARAQTRAARTSRTPCRTRGIDARCGWRQERVEQLSTFTGTSRFGFIHPRTSRRDL